MLNRMNRITESGRQKALIRDWAVRAAEIRMSQGGLGTACPLGIASSPVLRSGLGGYGDNEHKCRK